MYSRFPSVWTFHFRSWKFMVCACHRSTLKLTAHTNHRFPDQRNVPTQGKSILYTVLHVWTVHHHSNTERRCSQQGFHHYKLLNTIKLHRFLANPSLISWETLESGFNFEPHHIWRVSRTNLNFSLFIKHAGSPNPLPHRQQLFASHHKHKTASCKIIDLTSITTHQICIRGRKNLPQYCAPP